MTSKFTNLVLAENEHGCAGCNKYKVLDDKDVDCRESIIINDNSSGLIFIVCKNFKNMEQ